jgi:hypothetical protein
MKEVELWHVMPVWGFDVETETRITTRAGWGKSTPRRAV